MDIVQLLAFLGWMTVLNFGLLLITSIMFILFKDTILKIHSKIFSLNADDLSPMYLGFIARYKVLIIVFNLVPYLALRIIA